MSRIPLRWIAIGVFVLSSSLNYLDRQLLAALAPTVRGEFQLSNEQYGLVISSFAMVYAVVAPAAGWFIDRVGLNLGAGIAVALWSLAGSATAWTRSFSGLLACRTVLGAAEAAGIPATGKANATYLEPRELALGTAFNQVGITLGIGGGASDRDAHAAPLWMAIHLRFVRSARIPVDPAVAVHVQDEFPRGHPRTAPPVSAGAHSCAIRRFWGLALANAFVMTLYALWSNWTTLYFVQERHMTQDQANREFAWIPAVFATAGGFFGGVMSYRWIRAGHERAPRAHAHLLDLGRDPARDGRGSADAAPGAGRRRHQLEFLLDAGHQHQRVCAAHRSFWTGSRRPGRGGADVLLRIDDRVSFPLDRQRGGPRGLLAGVRGAVGDAADGGRDSAMDR